MAIKRQNPRGRPMARPGICMLKSYILWSAFCFAFLNFFDILRIFGFHVQKPYINQQNDCDEQRTELKKSIDARDSLCGLGCGLSVISDGGKHETKKSGHGSLAYFSAYRTCGEQDGLDTDAGFPFAVINGVAD